MTPRIFVGKLLYLHKPDFKTNGVITLLNRQVKSKTEWKKSILQLSWRGRFVIGLSRIFARNFTINIIFAFIVEGVGRRSCWCSRWHRWRRYWRQWLTRYPPRSSIMMFNFYDNMNLPVVWKLFQILYVACIDKCLMIKSLKKDALEFYVCINGLIWSTEITLFFNFRRFLLRLCFALRRQNGLWS